MGLTTVEQLSHLNWRDCLERLLLKMKTYFFFDLIVILLGGIAMYTPWIQLKSEDGLTGRELGEKYPRYGWIRRGFVTLYLSWVAIVFFFFYKALSLSWLNSISVFGGVFASIGLFIGLFAVVTGVSLLPMRSPKFLYVVGDDAQRAGRFQVVWSFCVIVIASVMEILRS
jgi:hypothetical protein